MNTPRLASEGWFEQNFKLASRSSSVGDEFRAATATFLTMSYILLVNPQLLANIGIPAKAVVVSTALSSFVGSFVAGVFGNLPLGLAPGIGLSAYLTYGLVLGDGHSVSDAFTSCFVAGVLLLILSVTGLSQVVMRLIPRSVKLATIVGMGLQIALVGMTSVKMVVANKQTIVGLGDVHSFEIWASVLGLVLIGSLLFHEVRGGILIGIFILTAVAWWTGDSAPPTEFVNFPDLRIDVSRFIDFSTFSFVDNVPGILSFLFIGVIDVSGVVFGMASLAGVTEPDGSIPGATPTFAAVSISTLVSAVTGGTPIIVYVESAAGIKEGGRTGLTAIFISFYFLLALFFAPVLSEIPVIATSPVAILVGAMMMSQAVEIDWNNMSEAIPAFLTLITMPLTFSITNGIVLGLITAFLFYITTGEMFKDISTVFLGRTRSSSGSGEGGTIDELAAINAGSDGSFTVVTKTESNAFMDDEPFSREPSLILRRKEMDKMRHNRSPGSESHSKASSRDGQHGTFGSVTPASQIAQHEGANCVSYI